MENNKKTKSSNTKNGSGSSYNKNHAGHLPDYGGNDVDPNAKGIVTKDE
ncbi:hypothetical protein MXL46_20175 [Heyndrickxia sporothermodurans]|uniref:Uncharacterized protein n=1 Tax=Heyndrickxia sporothermodurans TaxID=46224 RepID=A0A150KNP8_9BACI|nr:hypothetical protein [Heyndrickxia sporothermodurans]KYC94276.1 hypothetical protein B4102_3627 [Heyndrickxia sporothermodurans]MBL5768455.1 hypothetical protein [Heyndrickxia sporothermodurans]MBL5772110.1 hypothetical protein [Heyndrickxia sporothermodurans]MBL5779065.1 hypothetical protein [Heyndrickxia sporothermodurans]MBL5782693.1 hypothetical protein [Heyndrickxia sporothermodurans]